MWQAQPPCRAASGTCRPVSDTPNVAAADHESQPYRHEENELTDVRAGGSGWPTTIPCGACGNLEGNLAVWYSWWCSRNGVGRIWGGAAVG